MPTATDPTGTPIATTATARTPATTNAPTRFNATTVAASPTSTAGGWRRALVGVVLVLVVIASGLLAQLGSEQMRQAAPIGSVDEYGRVASGYSWSINPLGFTVRYDDGSSTTHLWW